MTRDRGFLRERLGHELEERLEALDAARRGPERDRELAPPDASVTPDTEVVLAGGGLSLLLAWALAARGVRVTVVERARAGRGHREWNASDAELSVLVREGLVTEAELEGLVVRRYWHGFCRFFGGSSYPVTRTLDVAVDAGSLLSLARRRCDALGVAFLDGSRVTGLGCGEAAVRVEVEGPSGSTTIVSRLVLDARGFASPYARADIVCPTVGGVLRGVREGSGPTDIDPDVGEILVTTEHADARGRQHVWEGFPGHPGETTVYLFYYALTSEPVGEVGPLRALYTRFFETLPDYKGGDPTLVRPTFGLIPGASRAVPPPAPPHPRVGLVGDAASRHSPLTFCGFGAMLRSLSLVRGHVVRALSRGEGLPDPIVHDAAIHAVTGGLSRIMAGGSLRGDAQNRLLDAAFASLHAMGDEPYGAVLRDEASPATMAEFLARTSLVRPRAYVDAARGLGALGTARWAAKLGRALVASRA